MEEAEKGSGLRATVEDLRRELERAREQLKTMVRASPMCISTQLWCGAFAAARDPAVQGKPVLGNPQPVS